MPEQMMIAVYILSGILGLCIGSFLNVVIYRLPLGMSLAKPGSHCTKCNYQLKWYDNIPVLSYLILGGKCRKCKTRISPRYMIVELFTAAMFLLAAFVFWNKSIVYAILVMIASAALICVFFIDLEQMYIPDRFQIMLGVLGIVAIFFDPGTVWYDHLIGCAAGGCVFLLLYLGAKKVLGREGIGFGDVKLAFATGMLLGWQRFLLAMLLASVVACLVLIPRRLSKKSDQKEFPFAPFIASGVLVALFAGEHIIRWYLSFFVV